MPHGDWDQASPAQVAALWALFRTPGASGRADAIRPKVRLATWRNLHRYGLIDTDDGEPPAATSTVGITRTGMEHIGVDPDGR